LCLSSVACSASLCLVASSTLLAAAAAFSSARFIALALVPSS
jgi:hypothetical protein